MITEAENLDSTFQETEQLLFSIQYLVGIQAASYIQCCSSVFLTKYKFKLLLISVLLLCILYLVGIQAVSYIQHTPQYSIPWRDSSCFPHPVLPLSIHSWNTSGFLYLGLLHYIRYLAGIQTASYI